MQKVLTFIFGLLILAISGCRESPPTMKDGNSTLVIKALWDNSAAEPGTDLLPLKNAKVIISSEYGTMVRYTDEKGDLKLSGLQDNKYNISIITPHPYFQESMLTGVIELLLVESEKTVYDTVLCAAIANTGITINEIYCAGPVNSSYYFFDQFLELFNSSNEVKYLDGLIVMRFAGNSAEGQKGHGADEDDDGDIDGVSYIYQFPGAPGEKNFPFAPHKFLVIAAKALNHKNFAANSIDLSNADWEFYNPYSVEDIDNPKVPNLVNLRPDKRADFLINLTNDVIVLASGVDVDWQNGIDISTILDAVEYRQNNKILKTLDLRLDKGIALVPARYSGQSIERKIAGFDTDNSAIDWQIIAHPSPGRQ